jgi:ABC-type transporter Mla subunit MlaD
MKSKNWPQYLLGTVVIVCSLVLLAALTSALSGSSWQKNGRKLEIDFHDATGIKVHSVVKFAGKTAGSVADTRYLTPAERLKAKDRLNAVRVTVRLDPGVPPLLSDLTARLDAETLLGEKFIALASTNPDAQPLPEGVVIQGSDVTSIDSLTRSAQVAIETVTEILDKLKSDYPALIPRLADLLNQGNSLLTQSSNLVSNVDLTVLNANGAVTKLKVDYAELIPKLSALLSQGNGIATNADGALKKVSALLERVDGVVKTNEGDLGKILEELRIVSQNLKVISTYTKTLTATLAEKPSRLIWGGGKKNELPTEKEILESKQPLPVGPKK